MNVPFQICSFIDVVCELVADISCFFHCLVYCLGLTAFCMWFNKGQAAWFGLAWLPVVCEKPIYHNSQMAFIEFVMKLLLFQGVVTGTGENSEFGEVFKMMKAEEVCRI